MSQENIAASIQRQPNKMMVHRTWQSVMHELTYLLPQESIAASPQRQPNKYDGSQDMAKRSA